MLRRFSALVGRLLGGIFCGADGAPALCTIGVLVAAAPRASLPPPRAVLPAPPTAAPRVTWACGAADGSRAVRAYVDVPSSRPGRGKPRRRRSRCGCSRTSRCGCGEAGWGSGGGGRDGEGGAGVRARGARRPWSQQPHVGVRQELPVTASVRVHHEVLVSAEPLRYDPRVKLPIAVPVHVNPQPKGSKPSVGRDVGDLLGTAPVGETTASISPNSVGGLTLSAALDVGVLLVLSLP
mmetsp:Transcript_8809/g.20186  ORF Transcript_8809/g.20186 Transcript_8809/m.20186 type:complete len:237 (-) Transcript_8809:1285-1995(-)